MPSWEEAARVGACWAAGVAVALTASPAHAFITVCHQAVTTDALDGAPWPGGAQSPPLSSEQALLLNELPFDVAPRARAFWSLSALIGNYYEDGGPYSSNDVVALAEYAARPEMQPAHCLRGADDDDAEGDARAIAACKSFVLTEIGRALGDGETPDLAAMQPVRLHLVFRGDIDVPLNSYAFHLGSATHAVQDGFTHMFRSPDKRQVRSVLNWVDWLKGKSGYVPARDGFQHLLALDHCGSGDPGGLERRDAARQATAALITAVADDQGGRAGRLARAGAVFDAWFGIDEICTAANQWCDAPERLLTQGGCSVAPASRHDATGTIAALAVLALALLAARSRRRRRWRLGLPLAATLTLGLAGPAGAKESDQARGASNEVKGGLVKKAGPEEQRELEAHPFGVVAGGGISIDNGGFDLAVGVRYDIHRRVTLGLGAEYNPWISYETRRTTRGTTQTYGIAIFRLDVRDYLELRASFSAGVSILMFDTFAAKSGSVGPYFALSPLGVAIRMSGRLRLLIDPAELVVAVPQTSGIPLAYRQHRFSVAVQANF